MNDDPLAFWRGVMSVLAIYLVLAVLAAILVAAL